MGWWLRAVPFDQRRRQQRHSHRHSHWRQVPDRPRWPQRVAAYAPVAFCSWCAGCPIPIWSERSAKHLGEIVWRFQRERVPHGRTCGSSLPACSRAPGSGTCAARKKKQYPNVNSWRLMPACTVRSHSLALFLSFSFNFSILISFFAQVLFFFFAR